MIDLSPLETLSFKIIECVLQVKETLILQPGFAGIHLREAMGNSLKASAPESVYQEIWDAQLSQQSADELKTGAFPPRGYIIEPPDTHKRRFEEGEFFVFRLILLGRLQKYADSFIAAVAREEFWLGRKEGLGRGKFEVKDIFEIELFSPGMLLQTAGSNSAVINFITPTRLKTGPTQRPLMLYKEDRLEFSSLIRPLLNRMNKLNQAYCGGEKDIMLPEEAENSARLVTIRKQSFSFVEFEEEKRGRIKKFGGFTGEIIYSGDIGQFAPILRLGEILHVGSDYVYGFGKYELLN